MTLRPEVQAFAEAMERRLRENEHKGGWKRERPAWLFKRLREEEFELWTAWADRRFSLDVPVTRIVDEAADVANFALMIADVCGGLEVANAEPR